MKSVPAGEMEGEMREMRLSWVYFTHFILNRTFKRLKKSKQTISDSHQNQPYFFGLFVFF